MPAVSPRGGLKVLAITSHPVSVRQVILQHARPSTRQPQVSRPSSRAAQGMEIPDLCLVVACSHYLNSISGYSCITDSGVFPWWGTYSCDSPFSARQLSTTIQEYSSSNLIGFFTATYGGAINAFSVQVRFQSSDFPTSTKTSTTPATVTVTATTTAPSQPQGLSTGAQAGIGVAVAIVVLALLLLGTFFYFRRRRRQRQSAPTEPPRSDYDTHGLYTKPELEADDVPKSKPPAAEPQIAELNAQGEILRDTDKAVSRPEPEIRESSASRSVAAKDQEPQPRPAASTGAVSTPDEPVSSLPEDTAARDSGAADEEESEEELRRKIHRTREERERLARIDELSRLEARLETKLAAKKRKEGDGGVPPI